MSIDRRKREDRYKPRKPGEEIETRKQLFDQLNKFVMSRNGWITSIPGADTVTLETLPDSTLPAELISLGYDVVPADPPEGQRILAGSIVERFGKTSSGAYALLSPESTEAIAEIRTHAGIVRVLRYTFSLL